MQTHREYRPSNYDPNLCPTNVQLILCRVDLRVMDDPKNRSANRKYSSTCEKLPWMDYKV